MDAVAVRLVEIGEAVEALGDTVKATEPKIRWRQIAGMRDVLGHHNFAAHPEIIQATVERDLAPLDAAIGRAHGCASDHEQHWCDPQGRIARVLRGQVGGAVIDDVRRQNTHG